MTTEFGAGVRLERDEPIATSAAGYDVVFAEGTAGAARFAAERVHSSELRKFKAVTSTTFLVLQREINLATQRGRELQAQTDLNKAVVELERVSGTILGNHNVDVTKLGSTLPAATTLPDRCGSGRQAYQYVAANAAANTTTMRTLTALRMRAVAV